MFSWATVAENVLHHTPIHWNIKSAPASPGRSRAGPSLYVFSLLDVQYVSLGPAPRLYCTVHSVQWYKVSWSWTVYKFWRDTKIVKNYLKVFFDTQNCTQLIVFNFSSKCICTITVTSFYPYHLNCLIQSRHFSLNQCNPFKTSVNHWTCVPWIARIKYCIPYRSIL